MQTQSHLLHKTRCPKCAERGRDRHGDNLGVYSDGHSYCFSCGYTTNSSLDKRIRGRDGRILKDPPEIPDDLSSQLSKEAQDWLNKYQINPQCLWSDKTKRLYFLLSNDVYQYRAFNDKDPKWMSHGISDAFSKIYGDVSKDSIVLVEDLISGMKVGHILPTMPLFGSNITSHRVAKLKQQGYNKIYIWLDYDKRDYATKAAQRAQMLGIDAQTVITKKDPKDYTIEEIRELLVSDKEAIPL